MRKKLPFYTHTSDTFSTKFYLHNLNYTHAHVCEYDCMWSECVVKLLTQNYFTINYFFLTSFYCFNISFVVYFLTFFFHLFDQNHDQQFFFQVEDYVMLGSCLVGWSVRSRRRSITTTPTNPLLWMGEGPKRIPPP